MPNEANRARGLSRVHGLEAAHTTACHPREREDPEHHESLPMSWGAVSMQRFSTGSRASWPTGSPLSRLSYAHNFSSGSAAAIMLEAVRLIAPPLTAPLPAKGRGEGARTVYLRGSRRDGISPALIQNCGCRPLSPPLCGERQGEGPG